MKLKKYLTYLVLTLALCFSSFSLFAGSNAKSIRARLDRDFRYQFNNTRILRNTPAIFYKGVAYAPIEPLMKALGYNITVNDNTASIKSPNTSPTPSPTPTQSPVQTSKVTGTIVGLDFPTNKIIITPTGQDNNAQVDVFVIPSTSIVDARTKQRYSFSDLNTDMIVSVTYTTRSTKSIPPVNQNIATEIIVMNKPGTIQPR